VRGPGLVRVRVWVWRGPELDARLARNQDRPRRRSRSAGLDRAAFRAST